MNFCSAWPSHISLRFLFMVMTEDQKAAFTMEAFSTYARSRRIVLDSSIKPHRFPGRGLGIAAIRKIQVCSGLSSFHRVLLYLPLHHSRTFEYCCGNGCRTDPLRSALVDRHSPSTGPTVRTYCAFVIYLIRFDRQRKRRGYHCKSSR